ncbi:hypothetical protein BsWGS_04869 [Bradybaena similaris]
MRQRFRQDSYSEDVVFLKRKIHIEDLHDAKPYCPEISQANNSTTTYIGSKYITVGTESPSCFYPQDSHERQNQYRVYEAGDQQGCAAVQDLPDRFNLLPTNVRCLDVPALASHCNGLGCQESSLQHSDQSVHALECQESSLQHSHQSVHLLGCQESSLQHSDQSVHALGCQESSLQHSHQSVHLLGCQESSVQHSDQSVHALGCQESSLQHSHQPVHLLGCQESSVQYSYESVHAEGNNFATQQLMPSGTSQKQLKAALELSEHVSFTGTYVYNNDCNNHFPALLPQNINNAESPWKHDYSKIYAGSLRASGKNTKNMLQNSDVMKYKFYIDDALERVESSDIAASLSSKRFAGTARKRRKRTNTPMQRKAANIREHRRMGHLNLAFDRLKAHVPDIEQKKTLSRIETLKAAIYYINILRESLGLC